MRRLREFMSIRRIRNKFLYITLAIGLIPLVVVGSISFVIATRNVRNSSMELYANNLSISNITVDLLSKNIESLARSVLGNGLIEHCMEEFSTNSDRYLSAQSIQRLDTTIAELISDNSYISSLFLFNEEGFRYQYNAFSRSSANLWQLDIEDIRKQDWYRQTMQGVLFSLRCTGRLCCSRDDQMCVCHEAAAGSPYRQSIWSACDEYAD